MIRPFVLMLLLCTLPAFAAYETPTITHSKLIPRTILRSGFWGFLDVVGNLDKIVDNRVVVEGNFQFRIGEGNWMNVSNNPSATKVWMVSSGVNSRRIDFKDMTGTSFDLRVCFEGQCSLPYIVYFVPRFIRILTPENGTITPFRRNLRFSLMHHSLGGVKLYIGKLDAYPGSSEIHYAGRVEIDPGDSCPQESPLDTLACEITIPDSIMEKPGRYTLTAVSSLGSSINYLQFDVTGGYKILKTFPERIESRIQDLITLQVADENLTTRAIHVSMASPCPGMQIPVMGAGPDKLLLKIPPECIPDSGCGEFQFDVFTPTGVERVKVPYQL